MNGPLLNRDVECLEPSKIRDRNRVAILRGAINLTQGTPDLNPPREVLEAHERAKADGHHQYVPPPGLLALREAVAEHARSHLGLSYDPGTEVTISCGATSAMLVAMQAVFNPGDEVILTKPSYENYFAQCRIARATPRYVRLRPSAWRLDLGELEAAFNERTKAIVLCNPNNPTGTILTHAESLRIAELCQKWDVLAIMDEVYDHIIFDGRGHASLASIDGMRERSIVINSMSKTYSCTGWRIGTILAPRRLSKTIRDIIDFSYICGNSYSEYAGIVAYGMPQPYYDALAAEYQARRDLLAGALWEAGFRFNAPAGAYYILAHIGELGEGDPAGFADWLMDRCGVAAIPGACFFGEDVEGTNYVRFSFCKDRETLAQAAERIRGLFGRRKGIARR